MWLRTGCWHGCYWMPLCPQQFRHIQAHVSLAARSCDGESESDRQTDEDTISAHMTTSDAWMDTFDMHDRSSLPDLGVDLHTVRLCKCIHLLLLHANVALQPEAAPSSTHLIGWQSEWTHTRAHLSTRGMKPRSITRAASTLPIWPLTITCSNTYTHSQIELLE